MDFSDFLGGMPVPAGYVSPAMVESLKSKNDREKAYLDFFDDLARRIEKDFKKYDVEDRNFLETLEIWVVRLRGHFGYNDNFTLETLKAGVVEKILIRCIDHPNEYISPYCLIALTRGWENHQEIRERIMALKSEWFHKVCSLLQNGLVTERCFAAIFLETILQYSPWREQFSPEEKKLLVTCGKELQRYPRQQYLSELSDERDDDPPHRYGRRMYPHLQVDIIKPMSSFEDCAALCDQYLGEMKQFALGIVRGAGDTRPTKFKDNVKLDKKGVDDGQKTTTLKCATCSAPKPEKRCPCKEVKYCNQSCQRAHWATHKLSCAARKKN